MDTPKKSMLISLGIFIGLIFFCINISLINFNRLVAPDHMLNLIDFNVQGEKVTICLLGETLEFSMDQGQQKDLIAQFNGLMQQGEKEAQRGMELLQKKMDELLIWALTKRDEYKTMF